MRANNYQKNQSGAVMISVVLSLLLLAGIISAMQSLARTAGQKAGSEQNRGNLRAFADGAISLCPQVLDIILGVGDYASLSLASQVSPDGGLTFEWIDTDAEAEITDNILPGASTASRSWWTADFAAGGGRSADFRLSNGVFSAEIDVDFMVREEDNRNSGNVVEFGDRLNGKALGDVGQIYGVMRCQVLAQVLTGQRAMATALIRKM